MFSFNGGGASFRDICGCYYATGESDWDIKRHYLPQVKLTSHTTINTLYFTTRLTQTFSNSTSDPIDEARYTFPLYDGVAVTAFTCTINDRIIDGHVEQKDQARKTYDDAVAKGQSAGLLESLPAGIFAVTLGNISAKGTVVVDITYGGELKHDAEIDGLRYTLPTSICPRYGQYPGELLKSDTAIASQGMHITLDADMGASAIRKIQSPSKDHPISVSLGNLSAESEQATPKSSKASVTLTLGTAELSADFILQIVVDDISSPKAALEMHSTLPNHSALIATFVPKFKLQSTSPEIVFIADQSGSMQGSKNDSLVAALITFIKSLPVGVRFNICPFGSDHKFLWEKSQPYTSNNATQALAYVQQFEADMGGTEMYPAVESTFKRRLGDIPLEIILLTDGEIYEEDQLFGMVNKTIVDEKVDARVFTLGIGSDVSSTLVEGVARAGRGFSQFVAEQEAMDQKVVRMLKAALYPHISGFILEPKYTDDKDDFEMVEEATDETVQVDTTLTFNKAREHATKAAAISMYNETVDLDDPIKPESEDRYAHLPDIPLPGVLQIPGSTSPLFLFNRTTVYLVMEAKSTKTPTSVILRAESTQGPLELEIPVQASESGSTVHTLAVRKLTHELEEGRGWVMDSVVDGKPVRINSRADEFAEREAVRLGLKYQVANKWCSFVAVEEGGQKTILPIHPETGTEKYAPLMTGAPAAFYKATPRSTQKFRRVGSPQQQQHRHRHRHRQQVPATMMQSSVCAVFEPPSPPGGSSFGLPNPTAQPASFDNECDVITFDNCNSTPLPPSGGRLFRTANSAPPPPGCNGLLGDSATTSQSLPPPMTPVSPLDKVRQLITLQDFAGYWEWNADVLTKTLGLTTTLSSIDNTTTMMTVIVMFFLKNKMGDFEGVWEMVVEKGEMWLDGQTDENEKERLEQAVKELFETHSLASEMVAGEDREAN